MCTFAYTYMCVCTWHTYATGKRVHTYVYGHMYVQACMHVWAHICAGTPACLSVHVYYMNTCVHACVFGVCVFVTCIWPHTDTGMCTQVHARLPRHTRAHLPVLPLAFGVSITAAC